MGKNNQFYDPITEGTV